MSAHGEAAEQVVDMATKATVKGVEVVANLTGKGLISLTTFLMATLMLSPRESPKTWNICWTMLLPVRYSLTRS